MPAYNFTCPEDIDAIIKKESQEKALGKYYVIRLLRKHCFGSMEKMTRQLKGWCCYICENVYKSKSKKE